MEHSGRDIDLELDLLTVDRKKPKGGKPALGSQRFSLTQYCGLKIATSGHCLSKHWHNTSKQRSDGLKPRKEEIQV